MDPNQFGLMARIAMSHGNFIEALNLISMALRRMPPDLINTPFGVSLTADRAECFWQLGHAEEAANNMRIAISNGLPDDAANSEEEAAKWTSRGVSLYRDHNYVLAEQCTSFALYFRVDNPLSKAQSFLYRALSRFELGNISGTQSDAQEVKRLDKNFARASAQQQKEEAMEKFRRHSYEKAVELFQLCLLFHPDDSSGVKFRRSVQSHQATAYFHLNNYRKALEVGESNSTFKSKDEAERWKDRGNRLSKVPNSLDLAIDCYSLALKYADEKDLIATILSNRSLMYKNTERYEEALCDAQRCVENKPNWGKAQYRLGSCLSACKRYSEALEPFSRSLQLLLNNPSSTEHDKVDTLNQVLSVAQKHPGGTCGIQYDVPQNLIQTAVDKAVAEKDWQRLHLLFMGGGGEKRFPKGSGGLGTGCDASSVPLEEIIHCDFKDLTDFISVLLDDKARKTNSTSEAHKGQSKEWFQLGCKAFANEDLMKAVIFFNMCLHLSDSSTEPSILIQTNHTLAEAYFKQNEHDLAVNAGKECFRLRSVRSEEEAKRWQVRASHVFSLGLYKLCVECVNLGLKYTPVESKQTFSRFLCQRSEAEQQLGDYVRGLEDARSALKMTSELPEGYLNQFRCLRALKKEKEAMQAVNECLKRTTDETLLGERLSEALDMAVNLKDGTTAITTILPNHILLKLMNDVIRIKDFSKLKILFLGGGGPSKHPVGAGGLLANTDAHNVPLGEVIRCFGPEEALISVLLEQGASVNVTEGSDVIPLEEAIREENLPLVEKLVQRGANCCAVSIDGEPMVHKAMRIGLKSGNLRFLEAMVISKCSEMENVHDNQGDTLYHLVCAGKKSTANKCNAIEILRKANVNPNLPNKKNMLPLDMVNKSDSRWEMINNVVKNYISNSSNHSSSELEPENTPSNEHYHEDLFTANEDQSVAGEPFLKEEETSLPKRVLQICRTDDKEQHKIQMRQRIAALIDALSAIAAFVPVETVEEQEDNDMLDNSFVAPDNTDQDKKQQQDELAPTPSDTSDKRSETEENEYELAEDDAETEIDSQSPFEKLLWEVDCTDRVLKKLRSRNVDNKTRKQFVNKMRMLANGRWNNEKLCKRLEGVSKKEGIHLYETRLTRGHRILWEKTIAFSGRLSDDPEKRLKEENSGGRFYTEIIRVWDIVLDHDKIARSVEHIIKSRDRGMDCLVKKRLKGISVESRNDSTSLSVCLPNKYEEIADLNHFTKPLSQKDIKDKTSGSEDLSQIFFPPASSNEQEYHILKFYSFDTPLATVLKSDTSTKVDFPFKITELEHAIVNLCPNPLTPIILLGRSGTGKTTCCLYRLWERFKTYWKGAATAGPYILKYPHYVKSLQCGSEEEPLQTSPKQGACGQDITSLATKPLRVDDYADSCNDDSTHDDSNESHGDENLYVHLSTLGSRCEDYISDDSIAPCRFEHLRQMFITKNTVLCNEVEKNFNQLCRAFPAGERRLPFEDQPTPARIQDVAEEQWPLFVNSRDWLLMLDASLPGETFFKRAEDGRLELTIEGWGEDTTHLQFIPDTESYEESDKQKDEEVAKSEENNEESKETRKEAKSKTDPRREITYQVFQNEIWPKMNKTLKEKDDYHPTLVWTEIRSFIKGSDEALVTENGFLSLEGYESLGRKKAPNFCADRKVVYELFHEYQHQLLRNGMFDEADLVFNIHRRLQSSPVPEWLVHCFYVDETQDFTQAELSLLIRCCRYPNELFFTGDTAQSIMRGIAFRFNDLKTLFHRIGERAIKEGKSYDFIRVPKKLYQLTHNYRSHAGILRLASSVVDLLLYYFPDSFDRLERDKGLFEGPEPVLLESCRPTDLALILQGNQRQSSRIEFGAHQVVLVVSDDARKAMPDELSQGLVMTIYEAKGLEFDDVLIYNFFKDSEATKEWRVVTSFTEQQNMAVVSSSVGLAEITEESVQRKLPRPLDFDPEKHKVLNSEFKNLYTAITRARVNVWFFDEDKDARAPVFEYFRRLGLVRVVALEDQEQGSAKLPKMFAVKSTPDEWRKRGMRFYNKKMWVIATQCFTFAGDEVMLQKSEAQHQAAEAMKLKSTNQQGMRDEFLKAGESFLKCKMYHEAEICLNNAKEWILLAKLFEKTGKYQDAARQYKKKGLYQEQSRCYESQNNYYDAIETLCSAGLIEEALRALERFEILPSSGSSGDVDGRQEIIPPKTTRTVERLRHKLADKYFKEGNKEKMEEVLQQLPSTTDRITFLRKRGCVIEAAQVMVKEGKRDDAAFLLRDEGMFQEAVKYSSDHKFIADCLLLQARTTKITKDIPGILHEALKKYQQCPDLRGQAEVLLMLGKLSNDDEKIQEAGKLFGKCKNCCGEVESLTQLLKTSSSPPESISEWIIVKALERLLRLITLLYKPIKQRSLGERSEVEKCEEHFGLFTTESERQKAYFCKQGGRFSDVNPDLVQRHSSKSKVMIDTSEAHLKIGRFLINSSQSLICMIQKMLENTFTKSSPCKKESEGIVCDDSSCTYQNEDSEDLFNKRFHALFNFIYLEAVVEKTISEMTGNKNGNDISPLINRDFQKYYACQRFHSFLFPLSGCRRYHLTWPLVRKIRKTKAVNRRILQFANFLWKETSEEKRRSDTDNFLKVSSSLQLIGSSSFMVKWICKEEIEFQTQTSNSQKPTISQSMLSKNGMVFRRDNGRCESYLQWWEDGKKRLYVHGDVENAAHLVVKRFLTLTAKRSGMIYPSIANTVMILEHQLTACLALYTRLCSKAHQFPICLPGSYLTMVRLWDSFRPNVDKGTFTLYEAVEHNVSQERNTPRLLNAIRSLLNYMVRLTCGELASLFDVLRDALSSDETPTYSTSGESERTLVLFLTMLCNCGKGISHYMESVMLRKILHITPNPCLPNRIKDVLVAVQEAQGYHDLVKVLNEFLQSRGEALYDLRWHNGKLWFDGPANPSFYHQGFYTDISKIHEELQQVQVERFQYGEAGDSHIAGSDVDFDATTDNMEVKYTDEELKEKENARKEVAATKIQSWFKGVRQAKVFQATKLARLKSNEEQMWATDAGVEHFLRFKMDSSACAICGTKFKTSTDDNPVINQEDHEGTMPGGDIETVETHENSSTHAEKEEQFQKYKEIYLAEIHPCLVKEKELRKMAENISSSADIGLDLDRLETPLLKVRKGVQDIETSLDWANTTLLMSAVKELEVQLQGIFRLLEQAKTDSPTEVTKAELEDAEDQNDELEEEGGEDPIMEMHQDVPRKKRRKAQKKKQ